MEATIDADGTYGAWLDARDSAIVAVRPDFHVWGTAPDDRRAIADLLDGFLLFAAPEAATSALNGAMQQASVA